MDIRAILAGVAFAVMWSSAFTSARVIVEYAPPLTALALRFAISGAIGVVLAAALGQSARLNARQWRGVVVFGVCQNSVYLGMNFIALQTVEAGFATIIASTMPLLVALSGWVILKERLRGMAVAGLLAGMAGVALIMGVRLQGGVDLYGTLLCLLAVISLTAATMAVRGASSGGNLIMIVGLQMLVGSAALWPVALIRESWEVVWSWQLGVAFTYTTLVPGLLATITWFWLVGRMGAVRAATFHFLNPFFGVLVGAALLGEALRWVDLIGVVIIAAGILAVQLSRVRPSPVSAPPQP